MNGGSVQSRARGGATAAVPVLIQRLATSHQEKCVAWLEAAGLTVRHNQMSHGPYAAHFDLESLSGSYASRCRPTALPAGPNDGGWRAFASETDTAKRWSPARQLPELIALGACELPALADRGSGSLLREPGRSSRDAK